MTSNIDNSRMMPWVYTVLLLPGFFIVDSILRHAGGLRNLSLLLPTLAIALFVFQAWKHMPEGRKRRNPIIAAVILFIPIVNFVGMYWAVYPLGKTIKSCVAESGMSMEVGDAFSKASCHLLVAAFALLVLFVLVGTRMPYSSIPDLPLPPIQFTMFAVLILWLIVIHVMFFHYSEVINSLENKTT